MVVYGDGSRVEIKLQFRYESWAWGSFLLACILAFISSHLRQRNRVTFQRAFIDSRSPNRPRILLWFLLALPRGCFRNNLQPNRGNDEKNSEVKTQIRKARANKRPSPWHVSVQQIQDTFTSKQSSWRCVNECLQDWWICGSVHWTPHPKHWAHGFC